MANSSYNIQIIAGSNLNLNVSATNSDGTYINLAGYTLRGKVKSNFSSGPNSGIILDLNPTIHPSYISGIVNINLSGNITAGLPCGVFPYSVEASITGAPNESVTKFLRGYAEILPEPLFN